MRSEKKFHTSIVENFILEGVKFGFYARQACVKRVLGSCDVNTRLRLVLQTHAHQKNF